jgi:hypothetical protein
MKLIDVIQKFSTARAEFSSMTRSVHCKFVVPPYIDTIDLAKIDHSMAIVGGRGCGKTTYVRYFSHWTQFDPERETVEPDALKSIVLYWKPDTAYCRSLTQSWLSEQIATQLFHALSGIELLIELISALQNISHHFPALTHELAANTRFWKKLNRVTHSTHTSLEEKKFWAEETLYDVQVGINAADSSDIPKIDPKAVFELLLPELKECSTLRMSRYKIFIDEFENLAEYQQRIINSYRKSSDVFFSWNVAHKRFATLSNATTGEEKLQLGNDYHEYTLDESFKNETHKGFFLCELMLLSLLSHNLPCHIENMQSDVLGDRTKLSLRRDRRYIRDVFNTVKRILPSVGNREIARYAISNSSVKTVVENSLKQIKGLPKSTIMMLIESKPETAIATVAISNQKSFDVSQLQAYIDSNFSTKDPYHQRVQTYLFTSLLNFNARFSYITIPVYAGFDRFCQLSDFNIRRFIDLCYNSFKLMDYESEISSLKEFPTLTLEVMHQGAINASDRIIKEIPTYTPMGLTLSGLANRLGDIFQIWQKGHNQSEPERTHFFIKSDFGDLQERIKEVIDQARCWRVLIEYDATKDKNAQKSSDYEYRLNPIYSPHFNISCRKIRRIEINEEQFLEICFADTQVYERIRTQHIEDSKSKADSTINIEQGRLF